MLGPDFSCGACKVLRKKCTQLCVFTLYFCYEERLIYFVAIHKLFGASNASKLLAQLLVSDRYGVVATLLYETQVRLQDLFMAMYPTFFPSNSRSSIFKFI